MPNPQFAPQYIQEDELPFFGLPTADRQSDILGLVEMASLIIDEDCGRIDGDGNGSLVYTTWANRILIQGGGNRNLVECPYKPLAVVDAEMVVALSGAMADGTNHTYTGVQANTVVSTSNGGLSPIIGCSGRFGYGRRGAMFDYADRLLNPLTLSELFGGPPAWVPIDVAQIDYSATTGELWIPLGLQLARFSEVLLVYNAGFNPLAIPRMVKHVCASLVKNALASGDATTFLMGLTMGKSGTNVRFGGSLLDSTLSVMLTPFRNVRSY